MAVETNSLVRDPDAFVARPEKPLLRDVQLQEIRACFSGDLARQKAIHVWVHGPPGAGKTLCVRFLLDQVVPGTGCLPVYVNCRERFTFCSVIEKVLDAFKPLRAPVRAREFQLSLLQKELSGRAAVIALDEVDALKDRDLGDLLHVLSGFPAASVICVAPSRQPLLRLAEPVRSRLSPRQVLFPRYRPEEMRVILEDVTARAVRKWKPEVLDKIIDHCFGDARRSIALLRHAVQRAEEAGAAVVDARHLVLSNFDYYDPGVEDQLDLLSTHHRLLYDLVGLKGPIPSTELERLYRDACDRKALAPVSTRTVKNYLDALCARRILVREHGAGSPGWIYGVAKPRKR